MCLYIYIKILHICTHTHTHTQTFPNLSQNVQNQPKAVSLRTIHNRGNSLAKEPYRYAFKFSSRASVVVQRLRIHLPV